MVFGTDFFWVVLQLALCQEDAKVSCCTRDEGWPFGVAL